jgi:hypothetical protein
MLWNLVRRVIRGRNSGDGDIDVANLACKTTPILAKDRIRLPRDWVRPKLLDASLTDEVGIEE